MALIKTMRCLLFGFCFIELIEVQALTQDHFGDEEVDAADGDIGKKNASEEYTQGSVEAQRSEPVAQRIQQGNFRADGDAH